MQERKKKKIVIASVLKPVDEPRMFGKIAMALAKNGHEVIVFGLGQTQNVQSVECIGHSLKNRLSFDRFGKPWSMLRQWLQLKPDILMICTHELLGAALVYKSIRPVKLIYDVQENYYLNIIHTPAFPMIVRKPLAWYTRLKEKICSHWVNYFVLAEQVYAHQLPFIEKRYTVIENKVDEKTSIRSQSERSCFHWLFTGTLSASTGVFKAIDLIEKLHALKPEFKLTICGYAPQRESQQLLKEKASPYIELIGIDKHVPHLLIEESILQADIGFIYYPTSAHTDGRIPTKYYEYSAWHLPILTFSDQSIAQQVNKLGLGWVMNGQENAIEMLEILQKRPHRSPLPPNHFWSASEKTLLALVE